MSHTRVCLLLLLSLYLLNVAYSANKRMTVDISNVMCKSLDNDMVTFPICNITKLTNGRNALDMHMHYAKHQILRSVTLRLKLFRKAKTGFSPFLYDNMIEFCEFYQNSATHMFWKSFYLIMAQYSNINHSCPYDHDLYIKNMVIDTNNLQYAPLPRGKYMFQIFVGWLGADKAKLMIYVDKN